jgi:hypothetical protein
MDLVFSSIQKRKLPKQGPPKLKEVATRKRAERYRVNKTINLMTMVLLP